MNRRGAVVDILVWVSLAFIIMIFLGALIYGFDVLNTAVSGVGMSGNVNITDASEKTIGKVNDSMGTLKFIAFILIAGLAFSMFITNYFGTSHPVLYIVHVLVTVMAVISAMYVSNAYLDLLNGNVLSETLLSMTAGTFIMLNLPTWTAIIGIFAAIMLYIGARKDRALGGSL